MSDFEFGQFNDGTYMREASNGKMQVRLITEEEGTSGDIEVSCLYFIGSTKQKKIQRAIDAGQELIPDNFFKSLDNKRIGTFESFEPFYDGQSHVQTKDGEARLKSGSKFYRTNALVDLDVSDEMLPNSSAVSAPAVEAQEEVEGIN